MRHTIILPSLLLILLFVPGFGYAQWSSIGPDGGGANLIAEDSSRPGTLIAGTRNALLYRSADSALTWQPVSFERSLSATLNTLVSGRCSSGTFFMGTTDSDTARAGVYRVTASRESWKVAPLLLGESVMSVAVSSTNCKVMAVGTLTGVLMSRDEGATWRRVSPSAGMESQPIVSLAFAPDSTEVVYAGTPKLPWKTMDGGKTWMPIHVGIYDDSDIFSIDVDKNRILIGACSGIYKSEDGGIRWQKILGIPGVSRRTYVVSSDPSNSQTIYAGTSNGLWKSSNAGATWVQKSEFPVRSLAMDPRDSKRVVLASDVGIWKSEDGTNTLAAANSGFVNRTVGAFLDTGNAILASAVYETGSGTLFDTKDGGQDWSARSGDTVFGEHIFHFARSTDFVYAAGIQHIFRSSNGGKSWTQLPIVPRGMVTDLKAIPGMQTVLIGTTTTLYASTDSGNQWQTLKLPPAVKSIDKLKISSTGSMWGVLSIGNVFLSSDSGVSWTPLPTTDNCGPVYDFALRADKEILIGTFRGLQFSDSFGARWSTPTQGLQSGTVTSVLWHPIQHDLMFAIQNGVPLKSVNGGAAWEPMESSDFSGEEISELYWASDFSKLYAVGLARGVFVRDVVATAGNVHGPSVLP